MDHLPKSASKIPYPKVEYVCKEPYDCLPFESYPARRRFNPDRLHEGDFSHYAREETASFLQNWLFFGLLVEVFRNRRYWVFDRWIFEDAEGRKWIDTENLDSDWFNAWYVWLYELPEPERVAWIKSVKAYLKELCAMSQVLESSEACPVSDTVVLSFKILGITIDHAAGRHYPHEFPCQEWRLEPLAHNLMRERGWCLRDISLVEQYLSGAGMLYAAHLRREQQNKEHTGCSKTVCTADQIVEETYQTRHRTPGCPCRFIEPDVEEIRRILRKGDVPIIELTPETTANGLKTVNVRVRSFRFLQYFIAISHVWSDGMGNPRNNSLPECQLGWLHDLLVDTRFNNVFESLETSARDYMPDSMMGRLVSTAKKGVSWVRNQRTRRISIWIDTLCVPLDSVHRKLAIKAMKSVYSGAVFTVALDAELLKFSGAAPREEILLRILTSSWMRRAWTLQEAIFANTKLRVQFADTLVDLPTLLDLDIIRRVGIEQHLMLPRFVGLMQKSTKWMEDMPAVSDEVREERAHERRWNFSLATLLQAELVEAFEHTTDLWYLPVDADDKEEKHKRIRSAWENLRWRSTSHEEDKLIIFSFACIMNARDLTDAQGLLDYPPQERMQRWIRQQEILPELAYVEGQKLEDDGFRWAPARIYPEPLPSEFSSDERERGQEGLVIDKPAYIFRLGASLHSGSFEFVNPGSGNRYLVTLRPASSHKLVIRQSTTFGLILSWWSFVEDVQGTEPGMLVSVDRRHEESIDCIFIGIVDVQRAGRSSDLPRTTCVRKTPPTQWCIR